MSIAEMYAQTMDDEGVENPVHVGTGGIGRDMARAELAAADFLQALGVSLDSPHLRATPGRMARAWAEMLTPRAFELTTFPNDEGYDELVLVRDAPVRSVCEHHLLPFTGRACVGYLPGERIVGLSKLARMPTADAGAPDQADRRLAAGEPRAPRRGRGRRRRAHVHDVARRPGDRLEHGDLHAARAAARRPAVAAGVPHARGGVSAKPARV